MKNCKETNQENINIEIRQRKFRWIGQTHYKRMTENPVKQLLCGTHKALGREEAQGTSGGEAH
jgi:hypothetical protein